MEKILVIAPSWLGDTILSQSLFKVLTAAGKRVHVLAPQWSFGILNRMPEVEKSICSPFVHGQLALIQRYQLAQKLRQENYAEAIVLPNSFKSALIPYFAGIKKRTGWLGEYRYGVLNNILHHKETYSMAVQRYVALGYTGTQVWDGKTFPTPKFEVGDKETVDELLTRFNLQKQQPILALAPGAAYGKTKRWPLEYHIELARQKLQAGWQVWLFGSQEETLVTKQMNQQLQQRCVDLAGRLKLVEVVDLLAQAQVVVSNDSGLMHLAAAVDRPVIAIYGSTLETFTPPLTTKTIILSDKLACKPCFKRLCPFDHYNCLTKITPQRVLQAIDGLCSNHANFNN